MMAQGRIRQAADTLRAILTSDAGNLLVRRDLGVALIELKEYEKAAAELRTVAAASPDDYVTRYELGNALEASNHLPEALDQFRAACNAAPGAQQCSAAVQRVEGRLRHSVP
jgi:tetratricopeptide (TPR) repeat protein